MTRLELRAELCDYCGTFTEDFDLYGVMCEIFERYPEVSSIDDIDYDEFVEILQRHDKKYCQDPVTGERITLAEYCNRMSYMED